MQSMVNDPHNVEYTESLRNALIILQNGCSDLNWPQKSGRMVSEHRLVHRWGDPSACYQLPSFLCFYRLWCPHLSAGLRTKICRLYWGTYVYFQEGEVRYASEIILEKLNDHMATTGSSTPESSCYCITEAILKDITNYHVWRYFPLSYLGPTLVNCLESCGSTKMFELRATAANILHMSSLGAI